MKTESTLRNRGFLFATATACWLAPLLAPAAHAQVFSWTKEQMVEYTKGWTGERFPDGRPRVPDSWLERAKDMSSEEVQVLPGRGGGPANIASYSQYDGDFKVLHPELKMAGRVVTAMYMPARADIDGIMLPKFREKGVTLNNQWPIDKLQPGDVLVIDMYGKVDGGGLIGDNLYYYIMKATKGGGLVVNGSVRDVDGISEIKMPAYVRTITPTWYGGSTLYGFNVPVRMGNVVVMPGDLAVGDREGVSFIPPTLAEGILDKADETHIHDEWTKMKFDQGKYISTDIYPSPRADELRKEYQEYLKKKLEELKASRPGATDKN
jgi:4-hydroxy-4-methyl-2-oxoglutarate aldolase